MTKWTTLKFITGFFGNTLGRKRVHGTYRVLEGDYCKLLVRATTMYGTPAGNELIAIDLSNDNNRMVFWKQGFARSFSYRVSRKIEEGIGKFQALPETICNGSEDNLLNSGIVDISPTHALIEIGDKPFLLHSEAAISPRTRQTSYSHANQVPKRVSSIYEAQEEVKDPIDNRKLCQEWWAKEMPFGFKPPEFDPELEKILRTALNPLDFGFEIDECAISTMSGSSYGGPSLRSFVPRKKIVEAIPKTTKVQKWMEAVAKWSAAADKLLKRKPVLYKGLSIHSSRYTSIAKDEERTGTIIVTTEGVFVIGTVHSKADWNQSDTLTQWFKLTRHANQINIPKCT